MLGQVRRPSVQQQPDGRGQNTRPTTAALCSTRLSAGEQVDPRGEHAWTVSGISTSPIPLARPPPLILDRTMNPSSIRLRTISSRKNGLPSARSRIRAWTVGAGRPPRAGGVIRRSASPADERLQGHAREVPAAAAPSRPPGGELGARGAQEQGTLPRRVGELLQQVEQRRVRPVDVLDHRRRRPLGGERREERTPRRVELVREPGEAPASANGERRGPPHPRCTRARLPPGPDPPRPRSSAAFVDRCGPSRGRARAGRCRGCPHGP